MSARTEDWLARIVSANRIFSQHSPGVCGVAKYRDGEWHSGFNLVNRAELPVLGDEASPVLPPECRNRVDAAERQAMANVAARPFLGGEIVVVLRNRGFVHGRAEVRRVSQILRERVIRQQAQAVRILAAYVDVTRVIPTLCRIFESIDSADGKSLALNRGSGAARGQNRSRHKAQSLERAPRTKRSGSRRSVVDEVSPLQVESARAKIADFDGSLGTETLLNLAVPLLNIFCRSVRIESGEADCGRRERSLAQNRRTEIQAVRKQRRGRCEVVGLLGLRENVWNVVALIAPGVLVDRSI